MMQRISAVIITHNAERVLERCLDSLNGVVDEIVVVDASSDDRTGAICRARDVRFLQRQWEGFSQSKNYANSQAEGDYILSLDADEVLSDVLRESLTQLKAQGLSGSYQVNRRNWFCGKRISHCGWYPDRKTRLFPRGAGRWEGDFVHERLVLADDARPRLIEGDLWHFTCDEVAEHHRKSERYAMLAARDLLERQRRGSLLVGAARAGFRFLKMYLFQAGFLDGRAGWIICSSAARGVYLKYKILRQLQRGQLPPATDQDPA